MNELLFLYSNCKQFIYRVQEGESIFDISKKFNQTPAKIIEQNGLCKAPCANSLICISSSESKLYLVKPSDTIQKIAQQFLTTEQEILTLNKVNYLYPFQIIEV